MTSCTAVSGYNRDGLNYLDGDRTGVRVDPYLYYERNEGFYLTGLLSGSQQP